MYYVYHRTTGNLVAKVSTDPVSRFMLNWYPASLYEVVLWG